MTSIKTWAVDKYQALQDHRQRLRYQPVDIPEKPSQQANGDYSPAAISLLAKARALQECVIRQSAWDRREVAEFIRGAVNCVLFSTDFTIAQQLLDRAEATYLQGMQAKNRVAYVLYAAIGGFATFGLSLSLWWILQLQVQHWPISMQLKLPNFDTTFKILGLATLGNLASTSMRMAGIDLKLERNKSSIFLLAITKGVLAISFSIIIFIILSHGIVSIGSAPSNHDNSVLLAAAFLCGFSERFASDILEKIPGVSSDTPISK